MLNAQKVQSSDAYDATVAEAKIRSHTKHEMQWCQQAWTGSGKNKRCCHWDGFFFGRKVAAVVWTRGKGYSAWAVGRRVRVTEVDGRVVDIFSTLATAQEEAMFTASDVPFAVIDAFASIPEFHGSWQRALEPVATAAVAGICSFVGFVMGVKELIAAERQAVIDASQASIEAFNAKFSAKGRKTKGVIVAVEKKTQDVKTQDVKAEAARAPIERSTALERIINLKRSFAELEIAFEQTLDSEAIEIVQLSLAEVAKVTRELDYAVQQGIVEG